MKQSFAILRRDLLRVAHASAAWIVVIGMIFLPPLYSWFNIIGFWDPYGNTRNIRVAIVNEDLGATTNAMGTLDLGNQIVAKLKANDLLGWEFVSRDTAMDQVKSGESYAAIIIPKDFSTRIAGVVEGNRQRPQLLYYVNEKANGIAAKITDTGAGSVNRQVNDTFVSTVSSVVSKTVNATGEDLNNKVNAQTADTIKELTTVEHNIDTMRATIAAARKQLQETPQHTQSVRQSIADANTISTRAGNDLTTASSAIAETQTGLNRFIQSTSTTLDQSSAMLSQASGQANLSVSAISAQLTQANGNIKSALDAANTVNTTNKAFIDKLNDTIAAINADTNLPQQTKENLAAALNGIHTQLTNQNTKIQASIDGLTQLNTDTGDTVTNASNSANAINTATQQTLASTDKARETIISGALPELNSGLSTLSAGSAGLGAILANQGSLVSQSTIVLNQLDQAAKTADATLATTDNGLAKVKTKLSTLVTDLTALSSSNTLGQYLGKNGKLDVSAIADFMLSPTVLSTKVLYPVGSYGSGMAPLFTNLSLWVGAFVLVVILKLEVDTEGIERSTIGERYWGRWMLLAIIAFFQGLVTTIGELIIGVQAASAPLFVLTGVIASLVYVSITYALSTTFLHVGKALCVALIILQIPGASGLYPIEMMPHFFRVLYPLFPFTYSISALRETIGGFYDDHWLISVLKLLGFAVGFFVLGLVARPHLITLNRLFAREIRESDMIIGEPILEHGREYQIAQVFQVLANKGEYRRSIEQRVASFANLYPRLRHSALIAGIVIPAALAITFSLTNGTKLVALSAWIIWVLLITAFLMGIELMRDSLERQLRLGTLSDDAVRNLIFEYGSRRGFKHAAGYNASLAVSMMGLTPSKDTVTTSDAANESDTAATTQGHAEPQPTIQHNHEGKASS